MKKRVALFLVILLLLSSFLFDFLAHLSIVSAGKIGPSTYITLKWGNGPNEVGLKGPYEDFWYFGPATFDVDKEGNVYIVDQLNERIITVDKTGKVIDSVGIEKITPQNKPEGLLPIKLIVTDKCMFLLYNSAEYLSVITKDNIITLNAKELLGLPIDVLMDRLSGNKVVLTPSIPPEDIPTWKGPKGVIVDKNGRAQIINELKNGSFDGLTPFADMLFNRYKDTWAYENVRIQVKDPKTDKVIFLSNLIENGAPIDSMGMYSNGNKTLLMYQTSDVWNEETETVVTHFVSFTLSPKKEEHYVMVVGPTERLDMLPPPFIYKVDFVLGQDGYFYRILYKKDGLHIQRFEPAITETTYFYRLFKIG